MILIVDLHFYVIIVDSTTVAGNAPNVGSGNANAKRRKIPAWLREELGRIEREKEKKVHNTSANSNTTDNNHHHSTNRSSSVSYFLI
jgi:hypothetical protein